MEAIKFDALIGEREDEKKKKRIPHIKARLERKFAAGIDDLKEQRLSCEEKIQSLYEKAVESYGEYLDLSEIVKQRLRLKDIDEAIKIAEGEFEMFLK